MAGRRQVPNAKLALQHNIGLGGAVVVALYKLGFPGAAEGRYTILKHSVFVPVTY
jgi:sterol carrier protein 2